MWKNLVHPSINQSSWTREEDALLVHQAQAAGGAHWDQIAEVLGTGRTGLLCFMRYQQKHNRKGRDSSRRPACLSSPCWF